MIEYLIVFIIAYIIGSIPFSYIIPKLYGVDIRKIGSGNVGGTNVYRALGIWPALLSSLLDISKSYLSCYIASFFGTPLAIAIAGIGAILGHVFSIFMNFKSGKGVSTFIGYLLFIDPKLAAILLSMAIVGILMTKIVSINSISIAIWSPMLALIVGDKIEYVISLVFIAMLIIYTHRVNIKRLIKGKELQIKIVRK